MKVKGGWKFFVLVLVVVVIASLRLQRSSCPWWAAR